VGPGTHNVAETAQDRGGTRREVTFGYSQMADDSKAHLSTVSDAVQRASVAA
jgi:hypothetical protein